MSGELGYEWHAALEDNPEKALYEYERAKAYAESLKSQRDSNGESFPDGFRSSESGGLF
jgi:hypothetical protein